MIRNGIDITKEDVRCCDDLFVEDGYINAEYETWFDIEKWLGITLDDNTWVNFYTDWHYETGDITCLAIIEDDKEYPEIVIELDAEEKEFFRNLMENYAKKLDGISLAEMYKLYQEEE